MGETPGEEMGKETFLLVFLLGAGLLAAWIAVRLPRLAPGSFLRAGLHLAAAVVLGSLLAPALHAVPGLPSRLSVLAALFFVALPVLTYMLLVGMWLVQLAVAANPALRR
jgi:hypothetical protein